MTLRITTLLSIILSAGLLQAQTTTTSKPKASATPDINKMITEAVSKGGASSGSVALKDPVAVVNGVKISKAELEKNFSGALAASGVNAATLTAEQKMQGYRQMLDGMIMDKLVDKQSADVQVSKEEVDAQLAKMRGQFPSEEAFLSEIKKSGMTLDQITADLTRSMRQNKWMQSQFAGKDAVTEDDAKKFYDANLKFFTNPDLVSASHILFLTPEGATPEQVKAAEAKAKAAIVRANKGEDFTKLASELTEEPGGKQRAGALPPFSKDQMLPEFSAAAFAQKTNTISTTPVKTKFGYHVIKVLDKKPAGTSSFSEVKDQLMNYLKQQKDREIIKGVMQELRQSAKIESNLPPVPAAAAAAPAQAK